MEPALPPLQPLHPRGMPGGVGGEGRLLPPTPISNRSSAFVSCLLAPCLISPVYCSTFHVLCISLLHLASSLYPSPSSLYHAGAVSIPSVPVPLPPHCLSPPPFPWTEFHRELSFPARGHGHDPYQSYRCRVHVRLGSRLDHWGHHNQRLPPCARRCGSIALCPVLTHRLREAQGGRRIVGHDRPNSMTPLASRRVPLQQVPLRLQPAGCPHPCLGQISAQQPVRAALQAMSH